MPDYSKAKIYKIWNTANDELYIGSTCERLARRMAKHRHTHKTQKTQQPLHLFPLYKMFDEVGVDNFHTELLEEYPCENVEQLMKKEGEKIRELGTLNKRIQGRTSKEWREQNKEYLTEGKRKWYQENKERILPNCKEQHLCECGKHYTGYHKSRHVKSKFHLNYEKNLQTNV